MTSSTRRRAPSRAFVWVWLPNSTEPVVAGVVQPTGAVRQNKSVLAFRYAKSYLGREDAISLWEPELPLRDETFDPLRVSEDRDPLPLAGCLRDAAPDSWGRRIINLRLSSDSSKDVDELSYLLLSGSNRIGALDFQASATMYSARDDDATLEELMNMAALVEAGRGVPESLTAAVHLGTALGGARPKALLRDGSRQLIAKFSSSTDTRPVVKTEALAMLLAKRAGLRVPEVEVRSVAGKDVLLVERFDRVLTPEGLMTRRGMLSMLTIVGLHSEGSWGLSYAGIAQNIRSSRFWGDTRATLDEMYQRLVFNIMVGNTDDHLRNFAAFWDGEKLELTPAYDIDPQIRSSETASHALGITRDGQRASQLRLALDVAPEFLLSRTEAAAVVERLRTSIKQEWSDCADQALLTKAEREGLWGRQFLNPYIDYQEA